MNKDIFNKHPLQVLLQQHGKILLRELVISNREIKLYVLQDNSSLLPPIFRLWYDVYISELNYPVNSFTDAKHRQLKCNSNGSHIFAAFHEEECIGTLRTTHEAIAAPEFEYAQYLKDKPIGEVTKLIIARKFRNTALKGYLMIEAHRLNLAIFNNYYICINSTERLLDFYQSLGFFPLIDQPLVHPVIGNKSILLAISGDKFSIVCDELELTLLGKQIENPIINPKFFATRR
jgi:predicted GNAT family N-acyltransferase